MILGSKVGLRSLEKEDLPALRDWRNLAGFRRNFREVRELNMSNQNKWFEHFQNRKKDSRWKNSSEVQFGANFPASELL